MGSSALGGTLTATFLPLPRSTAISSAAATAAGDVDAVAAAFADGIVTVLAFGGGGGAAGGAPNPLAVVLLLPPFMLLFFFFLLAAQIGTFARTADAAATQRCEQRPGVISRPEMQGSATIKRLVLIYMRLASASSKKNIPLSFFSRARSISTRSFTQRKNAKNVSVCSAMRHICQNAMPQFAHMYIDTPRTRRTCGSNYSGAPFVHMDARDLTRADESTRGTLPGSFSRSLGGGEPRR